jgi:hypothetical protein
VFFIESHAAWELPSVSARKMKIARATTSRIASRLNIAWNTQKARPKPNGKISGNAIGMI